MAVWNQQPADSTLSNVNPAEGRANLGAVGFADVQQFGPVTLSLIGTTGAMVFRPRFAGTLVSVAGVPGGAAVTVGASLAHVDINSDAVTTADALTIGAGEPSGTTQFDTAVTAGGEFLAYSVVAVYITGAGSAGNISITLGYTRTP